MERRHHYGPLERQGSKKRTLKPKTDHVALSRGRCLHTSCWLLRVAKRRSQQSGFTPGQSTADAILALRFLSEVNREFNRQLVVACIDLKAAFDSVDRAGTLWQALRGTGIPTFLLNLITDFHTGTSATVRTNGTLTDEFSTTSGVRQGCVLAPALFCRAINWILVRTAARNGGHWP